MNIYLQMNDVAPLELLFLRYAEAIDMTLLWSFCFCTMMRLLILGTFGAMGKNNLDK